MANRQDALSDYVRVKIREWQASGRQLQDLARIAGITKSSPSTVLAGTGVGSKTGRGYAVAFGYGPRTDPDAAYKALQDAAYEWWLAKGERAASAVTTWDDPGFREAVEVLKTTMQATEAQIRAIMADFTAPRFAERDSMFWIQTIGAELKRDRERAVPELARNKATSKAQAEIRAAKREKVRLPKDKEVAAGHRARRHG